MSAGRCAMRFSALLVGSTVVASATLFAFAQHISASVAPPPSVPTMVAVHTPPAPVAIRSVPVDRGMAAATTHVTPSPNVLPARNRELSQSSTNATSSSGHGSLFSFLRRHKPVPPTRSSTQSSLVTATKTQTPSEANLGCTVRIVPVNNPAMPCNPFAPCCP